MKIVLKSLCGQGAISRTAQILDLFASRKGDKEWEVSITVEGLRALEIRLRRHATRQTAVVCFVNEGRGRTKLKWTVDKKKVFDRNGNGSVAHRHRAPRRKADSSSPNNSESSFLLATSVLSAACLIARTAGIAHDLGKFGGIFQAKLKSKKPVADKIRHEWLSVQVLHQVFKSMPIEGFSEEHWESAWKDAWSNACDSVMSMKDLKGREWGPQEGLKNPLAALIFMVMTHHRLPGKKKSDGTVENKNLLDEKAYLNLDADDVKAKALPPLAMPNASVLATLTQDLNRLREHDVPAGVDPSVYWRAVSTIARMGLILADHAVSSRDVSGEPDHGHSLMKRDPASLFANTVTDENGRRSFNQELNWHLQTVGHESHSMTEKIFGFAPGGLSDASVGRILEPSGPKYAWQNVAADALADLPALPTLVINMAATGSGKTLMNVRTAASLRPAQHGQEIRFTTMLNLRTLALQTGDAYRDQLGLCEHEVVTVVGSKTAMALHNARALLDDDENEAEDTHTVVGSAIASPPDWLAPFLKRGGGKMADVIMAPVAVCTVDFLVAAGEMGKQAHHAVAMLRLATSDLILDEIDSYDPKPVMAVLRLVTFAAMWGRNVIASSATLNAPIAQALFEAYALGARMRAALQGKVCDGTGWQQVFIDNTLPPRAMKTVDPDVFASDYRVHIDGMLKTLGAKRHRPAEMIPVAMPRTKGDVTPLYEAVAEGCAKFHDCHGWSIPVDGQDIKISFGLVRVANIRQALALARHLAKVMPWARVACYHSQISAIQRFHVERTLDKLLSRHGEEAVWKARIASDETVLEALRRSARTSCSTSERGVPFIVVATPVEEIGRDHDFDYGIAEPSSAASLVQLFARINRHRLVEPSTPNVGVLQFNARHLQNPHGSAFMHPGYETEEAPYPSHDLAHLLDWSALAANGQIDARLRFDTQLHALARHDDEAIARTLEPAKKKWLKCDDWRWLHAGIYADYQLREPSQRPQQIWSQDESGHYVREEITASGERVRVLRGNVGHDAVERIRRCDNDWLVLDHTDGLDLARKCKLPALDALEVSVSSKNFEDVGLKHDLSFGFS